MHQPFYRDMLTGDISLPWVRLHAAKDYLHMGEVLAAHPEGPPDDQHGAVADRADAGLGRMAKRATSWPGWPSSPAGREDEKRIILNLGFSINWDNIIRRYPRYSELLDRRPPALADPNAFSTQDYRDLLAWFNLAWIDPNWLERDPRAGRSGGQGPGLHTGRPARDPR